MTRRRKCPKCGLVYRAGTFIDHARSPVHVESIRAGKAAWARERYYATLPRSRLVSRERVAVVRAERTAAINGIKLGRGCLDCGYRGNPVALQFDHRDPREKLFGIAKSLTCSWARLLAEIDKCDVRCANCHAIRSQAQGHLGRPRLEVVS